MFRKLHLELSAQPRHPACCLPPNGSAEASEAGGKQVAGAIWCAEVGRWLQDSSNLWQTPLMVPHVAPRNPSEALWKLLRWPSAKRGHLLLSERGQTSFHPFLFVPFLQSKSSRGFFPTLLEQVRKVPQKEGSLESLLIAQHSHSFPSPVEGPPHLRLTHEDIRVSGQQCKPKVSMRGQRKLLQKCQTTAPVRARHGDHRRAKVPLQLWLPEPLCECTTRHPVLLGASLASLASRQLDVKQVMAWRASGLRWARGTDPCCSRKDFVWGKQLPGWVFAGKWDWESRFLPSEHLSRPICFVWHGFVQIPALADLQPGKF